jgi:hypothetical protein
LRGKVCNGLALYKRHSAGCEVHATKLSEPAKRFYFECPCPIWITRNIPGTGDIMPRQATGENDVKKAEAVRDALIASEMQVAATSAVMGPSLPASTSWGRKTTNRRAAYCPGSRQARGKLYMSELTVDLPGRFKIEGLADLADTTMNEIHDDPKMVADQLGHTLDVSQNIYTRASVARHKVAVDALDSALPAM